MMEQWWLFFFASISITFLLKFFLPSPSRRPPLPPGKFGLPLIGNIEFLKLPFVEFEPVIRALHRKLGPIVSLRIGARTAIFISDRTMAHEALVQRGSVFADRPSPLATGRILSSNQHSINSARYGATWRLLRRNLTSEILHHSRVRAFSSARKRSLDLLVDRLGRSQGSVEVIDHINHAMYYLLAVMCFGIWLEDDQVGEIARVEKRMLQNAFKYNILNVFPSISRVLLRKKWREFLQIRSEQVEVISPLIKAREKVLKEGKSQQTVAYVDSLYNLELPEEKRKLTDDELVTLCNEFLNAGTDTTSSSLQWILANLVKHPEIQEKLHIEIKQVLKDNDGDLVDEEQLGKMQYLRAVVLEGLRRHPPGHFVLPHAVTEDVILGGHLVPKKGSVNFMVADIGWDPAVWEAPMEFRPERFAGEEGFDITGRREIRMMPFGAGRRMCPGYAMALLHLEFFVANLVWRFEWRTAEDGAVDLSEKQEFTVVMKHPLRVVLTPRVAHHGG